MPSIHKRPPSIPALLAAAVLAAAPAAFAESAGVITRTGATADRTELEWVEWAKPDEQKAKGGFYGAAGWTEYDIQVPADGWYELFLGGFPAEWPVDIALDGAVYLAAASGSESEQLPAGDRKPGGVEFKVTNLFLTKGKHPLRFTRRDHPPTLPSVLELRPAGKDPAKSILIRPKDSSVAVVGQKFVFSVTSGSSEAVEYDLTATNEVTGDRRPLGKLAFPSTAKPIDRDLTIEGLPEGLYRLGATAAGTPLAAPDLGTRWLLVTPASKSAQQTEPAAPTTLSLAGPFTSGAVLQRQMPLCVWGWNVPGSQVEVRLADKTETATAGADGAWEVKFQPFEAGGPHKMMVKSGEVTRNVDDLYFGEVWVLSGQSNMGGPLLVSINGPEMAKEAHSPLVRLGYVSESDQPGRVRPMTWMQCDSGGDPTKLKSWNAIPFGFGKVVHESLNVPIGLVNANRGGTAISTWISPKLLASADTFRKFQESFNTYNSRRARETRHLLETIAAVKKWKKAIAETPGEVAPAISAVPETSRNTPSMNYTNLIGPIGKLTVRGVLWYQGETDSKMAWAYRERFKLFLEDWRQTFGQPELPVVYAQIAYGNGKFDETDPRSAPEAELREAQLLNRSLPRVAMIVTHDLMRPEDDVHYLNKVPVGQRMGTAALATVYKKNVPYEGPLYRQMQVSGNTIRLSFDRAEGGVVSDGKPIRGFAIAGEDRKWVWAEAKIEGESVVVWSDKVAKPVAARYCWAGYRAPNLSNKDGLPMSTFRTDDWPLASEGAFWSPMK